MAEPVSAPMGGYGFAAALVQAIASLAWPAAAVVVALIFREKLTTLLPLLRVKHKDWEISFRLAQAEAEAASLPAPSQPASEASAPTPEETNRFEQLLEISPRHAMTQVRHELDQALQDLLFRTDAPKVYAGSILGMTRILRARGIIDEHTSALLDDLRSVGNRAIHAKRNLSRDDAIRYRALADKLIQHLATLPRSDDSAQSTK